MLSKKLIYIILVSTIFPYNAIASNNFILSAKCRDYTLEFEYLASTPTLKISGEKQSRLGIGGFEERGFSAVFPGEPVAVLAINKKNEVRFVILKDEEESGVVLCSNVKLKDK